VKNHKAPEFHFFNNRIGIEFSVEVDLYDEHFDKLFASIVLENIYLDVNASMHQNEMHLMWNEVKLHKASVKSTYVTTTVETNADQHVYDYFNWLFKFIIPWVN